MEEYIIFAPGANETELLRSLAKEGVNTIGYHVMGTNEFTNYVEYLSNITPSKLTTGSLNEVYLLTNIIENTPYFKYGSYYDAKKLQASLKELRMLIKDNEKETIHKKLAKGEFLAKNQTIIDIYDKYMEVLEENDLIDQIGEIRFVLEKATCKIDNIITLKEYKLSRLEEMLLEKVKGINYQELSLVDLFKKQNDCKIERIAGARGKVNEINYVFETIIQKKIPFDNVLIVSTDSSYNELIYDLTKRLNIPATFSSGVRIKRSNAIKLFDAINVWNSKEFNSIDSLESIINGSFFDTKKMFGDICMNDLDMIIKELGSLKISSNLASNKEKVQKYLVSERISNDEKFKELYCDQFGLKELDKKSFLHLVEHAANEFGLKVEEFIKKYTIIRPNEADIDNKGVEELIKTFGMIALYQIKSARSLNAIYDEMLGGTVIKKASTEGAIHVSSLKQALVTPRKHIFIVGLSADLFPGSIAENYMLLDSDFIPFGNKEDIPTSENKIKDKVNDFFNFIKLNKKLNNHLYLSYEAYNLTTIKDANPSSVLYDVYSEDSPNCSIEEFKNYIDSFDSDDKIAPHYFSNHLSIQNGIGKEFNKENIKISAEAAVKEVPSVSNSLLKQKYSPSAIEKYKSCPFLFFLERVMGLSEKKEDDPFEVIDAANYGLLAHKQMEYLKDNHPSKEDFLSMCESSFKEYLNVRVPLYDAAAWARCQEFVEMMSNEYDLMIDKNIIYIEEDLTMITKDGLKIGGRVDCVYKNDDGTYVIVDYKTGSNVKHKENDNESCLQALMYGYILENTKGVDVDHVEYHYLKYGKIISCPLNKEYVEGLEVLLNEFASSIQANRFDPCNEKQKGGPCKYCLYKDTCSSYLGIERIEGDGEDD